MDLSLTAGEEHYTLLGVRPDGVAPIVDLLPEGEIEHVRARATALLGEHASCSEVEVWRHGALLEKVTR